MADVKGLSILMSMKDVGVERSLKQIKAQFRTLSSEMGRSNNDFKNTERSMSSLSTRTKELRKGIEVTENSMKDISNQLKKMTAEEQRSSVEAEKLRNEYSKQNRALNMYKRQLNSTETELNQFGQSSKKTVFSMEKIDNVLGTLRKQLNITNMAFERGGKSTQNYQGYLNSLNNVIEKHKRTIQTLETRYQHVARQQGVNSKEAIDLRQKILQEKQTLDALEGQYRQTSAQAQRFAMEQKTATMSMSQIRQKITQVAQSLKISANNFKLSGQTASAYKAKIESLNNGMKQQQLIVQNLSRQYDYAKRQYGATSKEAQELGVQLSEERLKLKSLGQELNQTTQAHKRLKMEQQLGISSMSQIRNKMTDMNNALALSRSNFSRAGESVNGYKTHLMTLKTTMTQQKTVLRELQAQYDFVARSQGKNSQEARELSGAITQQKIKMNDLETEIEQTGQAYKELSVKQANAQRLGATGFGRSIQSVNKYKDTINNAGMAMRNVGSNMAMYVTLPVIAGFGAAIKTGMEFEGQMSRVGAIAGASKKQLKAMSDQALQLGQQTSLSASEVAKGMEELAALGMDANQVMQAMPGTISAAEASGADLATTASIMASSINSFNLKASDSSHVADVLAVAANESAADVQYMGDALKYAGAPANALGASLEDVSAAVEIMSNSGLEGSQAGTALRASFIRLANPAKQAKKEMDKLGVSLTDSSGKFVGMPALVGQFKNSLQGMNREQQLASVATVVGTEAASGFLALINAGPEKIAKYSKSLKESNGESAKAAKQMKDNLKGDIEQLGGAFETLGIKIMNSSGGPLRVLAQALTKLFTYISNLPGPVLGVITVFAGLAASIGPLLIGLGLMANGITGVASAFKLLNDLGNGAGAFAGLKKGLSMVLGPIGQIISKIPLIGSAFTLLTGPIGITIGIIAALGTAFVIAYKKSETFRNIVNAVINPVKNAIMGLWNGIKAFATGIKQVFSGDTAGGFNIFKKLLPAEAATQLTSTLLMIRGAFREFFTFIRTTAAVFGAAMSAFWKQHGSTIINTFNAIKIAVGLILGFLFNNIIKPILTGIGNNFRIIFGGLKAIVINVFTGIRMVVQGGLTAIGGIINIFKGLFTGNFRLMWQGIKQVFSGALTAIGGMLRLTFGNLLIFLKTIGLMMLNTLKTIWTIIKNVVVGLAKALGIDVRATITALKTVIIAIFTALSVATRAIWTGLKNVVLSIVRALSAGIKALFNGLKAVLTNIWNGIKAISVRVWNAIKNGVIAIVRAYVNTVKAIFNALKSAISSIFNSIKQFFIRVWTSIKNSVVSIARALYNNLRNNFNNLKNIIRSIFNAVKNFLYSIWTSIKNKVSSLAQNLRDSVVGKFNSLKKGVVDLTSRAKGYIVDAWNTIKSKVVNLAQGLKDKVVGTFNKMKDGLSNIIGKIKGFIGGMVDAVKTGLNKLIKGINWVADKLSMPKLPHLSTGTQTINRRIKTTSDGSLKQGTMAVVGDRGPGNGPGGFRNEMIRYPNGRMAITPSTDTTMFLPKGSAVYNGAQTHAMLSNQGTLPKFSTGTFAKDLLKGAKNATHKGAEFFGDVGKKGAKAAGKVAANGAPIVQEVGKKAGQAKEAIGKAIGDVMDYMDNPGKLVDKVISHFGVNFDGIKGIPGDITRAAFKKMKKSISDMFKGWLEESGGGDSGYLELDRGINFPFMASASQAIASGYPFPRAHHGIDINYPMGTPVRSTISGTAEGRSGYNGGFGNSVWIKSGIIDVIYGHLSKLAFRSKRVKPGDLLGYSGSTGDSSGPHLHYEMRWNGVAKDPMDWLRKNNGGGKSKSGSKWAPTIRKALKMNGLPTTAAYVNAWARQIDSESGGNPRAVQGGYVDANTGGNEAKGLVQVAGRTFQSMKFPGHGNVFNPLDNLLAGIHWAKYKYGSDMLGVIGHGHGYATGGLINSSGWYNLAEEGHGEYIVPRDPRRASDAMKIIALASHDIQRSKKGNKRPGQLPNINNSSNDHTELLLQMIENQQVQISQQQEQMNTLMQIARKDFKPSIDKYTHKQQVYSAIDDYNRQKERKSRF